MTCSAASSSAPSSSAASSSAVIPGAAKGDFELRSRVASRRTTALWLGLVAWVQACQADVSLGRFGRQQPPAITVVVDGGLESTGSGMTNVVPSLPPTPVTPAPPSDASPPFLEAGAQSSTGGAGASSDQLDAAVLGNPPPACKEGRGVGVASTTTDALVVTETSTDWSLPEPTTGMEWTLTIDNDVPQVAATVGYYWHNQFSFVPGIAGRIGLQTLGYYDPGGGMPTEFTHMAVFWLSGPPLDAVLGEIPFPDARVASQTAVGLEWTTIHARFDWEPCHTYRFKVDIHSTEDDGSMWYGAWITDETEGQETFLGRMLLPVDSGLLSTLSSSRTSPIRFTPTSCDQLYSSGAVFGAPVSATGQQAVRVADHFFQPFGCRKSLIADYDGAVRHEMSVAP